MPWGSWVTCEETVNGYDVGDDFTRTAAGRHRPPDPFTYVHERPPAEAARLHLRGAGHGDATRRADHPRRPVRARVGGLGPAAATRCTSARTTSRSRPASTGTCPPSEPDAGRPAARRRQAATCSRSRASTNADLAAPPAGAARPTRSSGCAIDQPDFDFGRPPAGAPPRRPTTRRSQFVSARGWRKGAAKFSRLEGAVYDHGWVYFTSTQGGGPTEPTQPDTIGGFGKGRGQIWGYDTQAKQTLHMLFESPSATCSTSRTTSPPAARHAGASARTAIDRQLPARADPQGRRCSTSRQNRIAGPSVNDEFAGSTFSPDGRDAVRQHPGEPTGCRSRSGALGRIGV